MSDLIAVALTAALVLAPACWLLGYRHGHDACLRCAVQSMRFGAALHRANGHGGPAEQARADVLDEQAARLERRLPRPPSNSPHMEDHQ